VLESGFAKAKAGKLRQECGAGILDLEVEGEMLWLDSPRATHTEFSELKVLERILDAKFKGSPLVMNVGPGWLVAELADANAVAAIAPDMPALAELSNRLSIGGVTVYGAANDGVAEIHVRSFAPAHGIPEDPVCGSGNISVAAYLRKAGRGAGTYVARQGMQLGRDGQVSIRFDDGRILLGGSAVTCVEGTIRAG
jgi:PhzF family phenazine biosynthesis protein